MITERPLTRSKKLKFHPDMFKDNDGIPDNSMFLERGLHINDTGLKALIEDPSGEGLFNKKQHGYIKLHLEMCTDDCRDRLKKLREESRQEPIEQQKDLPF